VEELMASAGDDTPRIPIDPDVDFGPDGGAGAGPSQRRTRRAEAVIVVALACGGVLGAVSRYAISLAVPTETARFPWGTFLINVSGSAALGFVLVLIIDRFPRGR
jgi:CrcB protein